jgi:hypothetical protein
MMKVNNVLFVLLAVLLCILSTGNKEIIASERVRESAQTVGPEVSAAGTEEESGGTEEIAKMPILTVSYQPYDIYDLAQKAFGMQPDEVDQKLNEDGQLMITPENREVPNGNTVIYIYTAGIGASIRWEDLAEGYRAVFSNALLMARDSYCDGSDCTSGENQTGRISYANYDYTDEPSAMKIAFPMDEEKQKTLNNAAEDVAQFLESVGIRADSWYGGVTDAEFWEKSYADGGCKTPGFEPEDEVCFLRFSQAINGFSWLDLHGESEIYAVYSAARHKILMLDLNLPITGQIQSEQEITVIPEPDIRLLAEDILKTRYCIASPEVTEAQLVYVAPMFGKIDEENQTMILYPAWQVGFTVYADGEPVTDYLYLNAETGVQYTNEMPL